MLPFIISHCADIRRPTPARKQRFDMNIVWFSTPRKPIMESERVIRVVAKPPNPSGPLDKSVSMYAVDVKFPEYCSSTHRVGKTINRH